MDVCSAITAASWETNATHRVTACRTGTAAHGETRRYTRDANARPFIRHKVVTTTKVSRANVSRRSTA